MVRLVDDDEVERQVGRRRRQLLVGEQGLEGDDGVRRAGQRRLRAAQRLDAVRGEEREEGVELVEELGQPLEGEVLGDHHQDPLGEAELPQAREDQARLDRLAEADLVGEDEARQPVGEDAAGGADLVREDVDAGGEERAEAVGAAQRLEAEDAGAEGEGRGRAGLAGRRARRAGRPRVGSSGVSAGTSSRAGSRAETTVTPSRPAKRTASAAAVVADLDDHAHAPGALGAVDDFLPLLEGHSAGVVPPARGRNKEPRRPATPRGSPRGGPDVDRGTRRARNRSSFALGG